MSPVGNNNGMYGLEWDSTSRVHCLLGACRTPILKVGCVRPGDALLLFGRSASRSVCAEIVTSRVGARGMCREWAEYMLRGSFGYSGRGRVFVEL